MTLISPASTPATAETVPSETIGDYPLLRVIACGAMGVLYESLHPHTNQRIALKVLRRDLLDAGDTEGFLARFREEARIAADLDHAGIVAVYDYGAAAGHAYIAMEYVDGCSLQDCFQRKVTFSPADAVLILVQLLAALQHAHDRGVWHRDIKPANVLITQGGQVKIADFGIAATRASAF